MLLIAGAWRQKVFDKTVTLDKQSKIPYGAYLTHSLLPVMFPGSHMVTNRESPLTWADIASSKNGNELCFLLTRHFNPTRLEMLHLIEFVKQGNYVFISTSEMNTIATKYLGVSIYSDSYDRNFYNNYEDSVNVNLIKPAFPDSQYFNPGYTFSTYFKSFDTGRYEILGKDGQGSPNFLKVQIGKGSFCLHSDPFLFANYYLLNAGNKDYFEKVISVVPGTIKKIVWDEYYVYKLNANEKPNSSSPLHVLLKYQSFRWAFYTAVVFLVLYLFLNIKRGQRLIPVVAKPTNDSLDFVKTIGRLYFERQDHVNIAGKMATYFLEHVRNKYFISTSELDDEFIQKLSGKSGYSEDATRVLVQAVNTIQQDMEIGQQQLTHYYYLFQQFYKHTT